MPPTSILVYGRDQRLLETRSWVLEQAGFPVASVTGLADAEQALRRNPVGVIVLCHTLSAEERLAALGAAQRLRPGVQRMVMTADALVIPDEGQEETMSAYDGPRKLIVTVQQMMDRHDAPR